MSDEPTDRVAKARVAKALKGSDANRPSQGEVLCRDDRAFDLLLFNKYTQVLRLLQAEFGCGICAAKASVARARINMREALGEKREARIAKTICRLESMIANCKEPSDQLAAIKTEIDLLGLAVPKPGPGTSISVNVENNTTYDLAYVDAMKDPELRERALQLERDIANTSKQE